MIQRLQTIFLAMAAIVMAFLFNRNISFASAETPLPPGHTDSVLADGIYNTQDHIILLVLVILGILIPIITIFLYKNRPLQMKLSRLTIALIALSIILTVVFFYLDYNTLATAIEVKMQFGYVIPVIAIIFLALAVRFIKKDEKLVRSADRLR